MQKQFASFIASRGTAVVVEDAATMVGLLRAAGWNGAFAYRHADEAAREAGRWLVAFPWAITLVLVTADATARDRLVWRPRRSSGNSGSA